MQWFQIKLIDRLTVVLARVNGDKSFKSLELPDYPWEESKSAVRKYGDRGDASSADVIGYIDSLYE